MSAQTAEWMRVANAALAKLDRLAVAAETLAAPASEDALLDSAAAHAKATTISWDEFLRRVREQPGYNYPATQWYAAGRDLEAVKHLPGPEPTPPAPSYLAAAQARIFLANDPLDCLRAPGWMTPVCTADRAYRYAYTAETIRRLREHFRRVEAWCDCVNTPYHEAQRMTDDLRLDGPPWGQCETTAEFDAAYVAGARRMVGKIDVSVLDEQRLARVASGEVLLSVELYRNCQPWLEPDYRNANAGVGGNCVAVYRDADCSYLPIADYKIRGYYVAHRDSVYGVGLTDADWAALA